MKIWLIVITMTTMVDGIKVDWAKVDKEFDSLVACEKAAREMSAKNYLCLNAQELEVNRGTD